MLESKSDFLALFPNGTLHQIRSTTELSYADDGELAEAAPADYPQCRVRLASALPMTERESNTSYLDTTWEIDVRTGQHTQSKAHAAFWAIYRAMLGWRTYVRNVVKWNNKYCVADVDAKEVGYTDQHPQLMRGTKQWITVWSTKVKLYFATDDLEDQ